MPAANSTGMARHFIPCISRRTAAPVALETAAKAEKKGAISDEWLGHSRGGLTTKIHLCADGNARPLCVIVTTGQCADITQTGAVLDAICVHRPGRGRPPKRHGACD